MSRSYKKQPVVKDKPLVAYNKRFRQHINQIDFNDCIDDDYAPVIPKRIREVINDRYVCDEKLDLRDMDSPSDRDKRRYQNK